MAIDLAEQSSSPNNDLLSTSLSDNSQSAQNERKLLLFSPQRVKQNINNTNNKCSFPFLCLKLSLNQHRTRVEVVFLQFFIDLEDFNYQ